MYDEDALKKEEAEDWLKSMHFEKKYWKKMDALYLVNVGADNWVTGSKCLFDLKEDGKGNVMMREWQLVATDFSHKPGLHFK